MSYRQWCKKFMELTGWTSVKSGGSALRADYDSGMTPEYAAMVWTNGYDPNGEVWKATTQAVNAAMSHF